MNVAVRKPWTRDEFLAWVVDQEGRYEFDGVGPVSVNGGTVNHGVLIQNLLFALRTQFRGTTLRVLGQSIGVATVNGGVRYPDAVVLKGKVAGTSLLLPDPVALFEILSPSTRRADRTDKLGEYGSIPSVLHYGLIDSGIVEMTLYSRDAGHRAWRSTSSGNLADTLTLPGIGATLRLEELYEDVDLGESQSPPS